MTALLGAKWICCLSSIRSLRTMISVCLRGQPKFSFGPGSSGQRSSLSATPSRSRSGYGQPKFSLGPAWSGQRSMSSVMPSRSRSPLRGQPWFEAGPGTSGQKSSASGTPSLSESVIATLATGRPGCSRMTTLTAPHCCEPATAARAAPCATRTWSSARPPFPCDSSTSAKRRFASAAASSRGAHWSARCLRATATSFSTVRIRSRTAPPVAQEQRASKRAERESRILLVPRRRLLGRRARHGRRGSRRGSGGAAAALVAGALDRVARESQTLLGEILRRAVLGATALLARFLQIELGRDRLVGREPLAVGGSGPGDGRLGVADHGGGADGAAAHREQDEQAGGGSAG